MFGKGELVRKADGTVETAAAAALKDLPFQTFECESCGLEMRPAKGRADVILGRERFRCSRCGAKASAYFNVDDLEDPRAVARLERIKEADNLDEANMDDDDEPDNTSVSLTLTLTPTLTLTDDTSVGQVLFYAL
jgi:rubredoxin